MTQATPVARGRREHVMSKFLFQDTLPGGGVSPLDISTPPPTKGQRSKRPQPRRLGTRAASLMPPTKAPARRQDPEEEGEEELDEESGEDASEEDDYVELDLERTLTWTGNAVIVQAGGEFRMPLIVPHPSVLAIQFEVDNGADIEFSLMFKDDNEDEANLLVEPVRVTDREGQLDIDTTGMCEIIWSNNYAWMSSKTLSYQLQLAPKIDLLKKKWRQSIISAASDFRIMSAVSGAEKVDNLSKTIKQRKAELQDVIATSREKTSLATTKYERYQGHVQRLEEEVKAAKVHAEAAASELQALHKEVSDAERTLIKLQNLRTLDQGVTAEVLRTLERVGAPVQTARRGPGLPWHSSAPSARLEAGPLQPGLLLRAPGEQSRAASAAALGAAPSPPLRTNRPPLTPPPHSRRQVDEPLELLFDAYATSMYEQPQEEGEDPDQPPSSIDRAEVLHLLQARRRHPLCHHAASAPASYPSPRPRLQDLRPLYHRRGHRVRRHRFLHLGLHRAPLSPHPTPPHAHGPPAAGL